MLSRLQIIRVDAKENVRKQIVRELQVGHDCSSPYVITFYGAFQNEARDIVLCMEYMDCGYVLSHIPHQAVTDIWPDLWTVYPKTSVRSVSMCLVRSPNLSLEALYTFTKHIV